MRGKTNIGLRAEAEQLVGEIRDGLDALFFIYDEISQIVANMKAFRKKYIEVKSENIKLGKEVQKADRGKYKPRQNRAEMIALVQAYVAEHPEATWLDLYDTIPNKYKNANSMAGSLDIKLPIQRIGAGEREGAGDEDEETGPTAPELEKAEAEAGR